jgi:hypothetical protein
MFFESVSRGWRLTKVSFKVLSLDKEILALPLFAGVLMIAAVLGIGYGAFGVLTDSSPATLLVIFGIYVLVYAISIYFNAAVIEMATIRFNGGDPVLADGFRLANKRLVRILQWALVAATVGIIFRILRDQAKDNFLAQILISFLEFGWNIATFFVVPVAVYQDVGPFDAIKGSMGMMKRTWGESLTGIATTGIVFFLLGLLGLVPLAIGFFSGGVVFFVMVAVAVVYWIGLAAVNSAVDGILVAGLYKYANEGRLPEAFENAGVEAQQLAW